LISYLVTKVDSKNNLLASSHTEIHWFKMSEFLAFPQPQQGQVERSILS